MLVLPHGDVKVVEEAAECATLAPNFVKCLLGEPRLHLEKILTTSAHPMLTPFAACERIDDALALLVDLRNSLTVTPDERDFLDLWKDSWRARNRSRRVTGGCSGSVFAMRASRPHG